MVSSYIVVLLVIAINPGCSRILDEVKIVWPTSYHYKGELIDLSVGIVEPFEIWYDTESNKSRLDYYGGTVKRYYFGATENGPGSEYQINYVTMKDEEPTVQCERRRRMQPPMNFLFDISNFKFKGNGGTFFFTSSKRRVSCKLKNPTIFAETITYDGKSVQVWELLEVKTDVQKYLDELYVYKNDESLSILLKHEEKIYNLWNGVLQKHIITNYFDYKTPSDVDLNIDLEVVIPVKPCNEFSTSDLQKALNVLHPMVPSDIDELFHSYKSHHNRNYEANEHEMRKSILEKNWQQMIYHNNQNLGFKLTINKFSDRTEEEMAYLVGTRPSNGKGTVSFPYTAEEVDQLALDLPENYDMRIEGVISSIKNQGNCGSCWTFSTTAAVEGALARKNGGRDLDLSEQSMVDCAWGFNNGGCEGGMIDSGYKYILAHGLPTQMEYGNYLAVNGECHIDNMTDIYTIQGFTHVPASSVNALKVALYKYGPVSVGISVDQVMKFYSSGIFFDPYCKRKRLNHAVVVVGYGVRDGATYWIVKNSWGEDWGQDGYVLMSATDNNCHLLEDAYYPVV